MNVTSRITALEKAAGLLEEVPRCYLVFPKAGETPEETLRREGVPAGAKHVLRIVFGRDDEPEPAAEFAE